MQKTFLMLKPDAYDKGAKEAIIKELKQNDLLILEMREEEVTIDTMKILLEHYHEVIDKMGKEFNFVGKLFNTFYFEGPHYILPMCIGYNGEDDIIELTRTLIGATNPEDAEDTSIRSRYSDDNYIKADKEKRLVHNLIHASDSHESAKRELELWGL